MINKIVINNAATFQGIHTLDDLRTFNYFFGANATGKTTISRVLCSPDDYPACSVAWDNQNPLEVRVYNRDFVDHNFNQPLKGVFTLGEKAKEKLDDIETTKESIKRIQGEIDARNNTLQGSDGNGGKQDELKQLTTRYKSTFFTMKQKHADNLSGTNSGEGLRGFIGSQDSFMEKVLGESASNKAQLLTQAELEEKAKTIFSNNLKRAESLSEIESEYILKHEKDSILRKRIIGNDDVDIAAMILKLNNSDWVRLGIPYYEVNEMMCPFCQQITDNHFKESLTEYFDETFTQDTNKIKLLVDNYSSDTFRIQSQIQELIDSQSDFLNIDKLKIEKQLLDSIIVINKQRLAEKQKESSHIITLDSHENVLSNIVTLIDEANKKILENNRIVSNLKTEKEALTTKIWKFVISELSTEISEYKQQKSNIDSAINNLNAQIKSRTDEKLQHEIKLSNLEKQSTSTVPTRDNINHLLDMFGFKSFKLELGDKPDTYKLIREDGSDVKNLLSEGEKNFLAFLYFYHLLKGSHSEINIDNQKIVVIDDPVSSLDNDVLFIVSTLIRELIQNVRDNINPVRQIFILSHNVYFHKEIVFSRTRRGSALSEESFWLVKKDDKISFVERQLNNPIKTSYELLWAEVRSDDRNKATIQNILRRILENYFKLIGGIHIDELYKEFEGEDKLKCKALCSWVNDGSHSAFGEEYYTPLDEGMIQKFLEIFKQIFQKTDNINHYNMMMGIEP